MFKEKNLPRLIIITPILAILLISSFTGYFFVTVQYQMFEQDSVAFEKEFIKSKKDLVKKEVSRVYNYLVQQENVYSNRANEKVIKNTILLKKRLIQLEKDLSLNNNRDRILKNLVNSSTSKDSYYFAFDVKNNKIIQAEGKNIEKEFYDDDKFFHNYLYSEVGKLIPFTNTNKIVYVHYLPKLDWIIGNIEYINKDINFIKSVSKKYIKTIQFDSLGYSWLIDKNQKVFNEKSFVLEYTKGVEELNDGKYLNYKDGNTEKLAYIKYFEKWNWVLASSIDYSYVKETIKDKKLLLKTKVEKYLKSLLYISIFSIFIITFIFTILSNKISKAFKNYTLKEAKQKKELLELNNSLAKKLKDGIQDAQEKDRAMLHQSRLARLGTMLSMIAHQWRQPLTEVSAILVELETATQFDKVNKKFIYKSVEESNKLLLYMSNTIDDFRKFFKPDKQKEEFLINKVCEEAISLMHGTYKELGIKLQKDMQKDEIICGYPREFSQVILNLLINAKDVFLQRKIKNAQVDFIVKKEDKRIVICILDNAGGIEEENINKIFDPYFSTKTSVNANGLGLFMSKMIIERNMDGKLYVENKKNGANFTIELNQEILNYK